MLLVLPIRLFSVFFRRKADTKPAVTHLPVLFVEELAKKWAVLSGNRNIL
jgi:hypothetical protein